MKYIVAAIGLALSGVAGAQEASAPLALSCRAEADVNTVSHGYERQSDKGYQWTERRQMQHQEVRVEFTFEGDAGRMRMPEEKPDIFSKKPGPGGWYTLERVRVGEEAFEGKVTLGFLNTLPFRIDRRTGALALGDFRGQCERTPLERKF
jgi:hypothetical protein